MFETTYHYSESEGHRALSIFPDDGSEVIGADGDHPRFDELLASVKQGASPDELRELADLSYAAARALCPVSERVAVSDGVVYFDGDAVDSALSRQIVRCLDADGLRDARPLVRFMENAAQNPDPHSRDMLYDWLRDRDFTIRDDGTFVAYKGVKSDGGSCFAGGGYVREAGESEARHFPGSVPNPIGAEVSMARSSVNHDPANGCSVGLHVGTHAYASNYGERLLTVAVNPRDVVSVPTDCNAEKMRVSRYRVVNLAPATPYSEPIMSRASDPVFGTYAPDETECDCEGSGDLLPGAECPECGYID